MKSHRCSLYHKVVATEKENVPIGTLESGERIYLPIFSLDLSGDRIILKDSLNIEVVADRTAMWPVHGIHLLRRPRGVQHNSAIAGVKHKVLNVAGEGGLTLLSPDISRRDILEIGLDTRTIL